MKCFILKIGIFFAILGIVLLSLEFCVRSVPNEYSYKYNYLEKNINNVEILCVGSSAARSAIDPECFVQNAFNVAQVSQDLEQDCAIIHKYISRADSLKMIIFPILPMAYSYRMGEGIEAWRLRKYPIYMKLDVAKPSLSDRFEISNFSGSIEQIIKYLKGEETVTCYTKGMGDDNAVDGEDAKIAQGLKISQMHNEHFFRDDYDIIVPIMEKTIKECADYHIDVVIAVLPCYYTYSDNIDRIMVSDCDSISHYLADKYSNVTYFDLFTNSSFNTNDFRNSNHLSQAGAKKLTKKIIQLLGL